VTGKFLAWQAGLISARRHSSFQSLGPLHRGIRTESRKNSARTSFLKVGGGGVWGGGWGGGGGGGVGAMRAWWVISVPSLCLEEPREQPRSTLQIQRTVAMGVKRWPRRQCGHAKSCRRSSVAKNNEASGCPRKTPSGVTGCTPNARSRIGKPCTPRAVFQPRSPRGIKGRNSFNGRIAIHQNHVSSFHRF